MENKKYYTVFNYKMARYLLKNGCTVADVSLNKNMKGIVFHFINSNELQELINKRKNYLTSRKSNYIRENSKQNSKQNSKDKSNIEVLHF